MRTTAHRSASEREFSASPLQSADTRRRTSRPSYSASQAINKDAQFTARQAYPQFLSLLETLLLQLSWAWRGLIDAFRWDVVVTTIYNDSEIRANILKSVLLNSLSLFSIHIFDLILQPLVQDQQRWLHRNIGWFYRILWLFPLVGTSLYLNSSWCLVVANRAYMLRHGSRKAATISTYSGLFTALATSAYRSVMMCTSVIISFALAYLPVIGNPASFMFFCWVDAYYCFEFIWIARGLSLTQRIRHLEERWAYYFAFGLPSSALCVWGSSLANVATFALLLPSYIIMAMHARPVPSNPYNPRPNSFGVASPGETVLYPSPFVPIRLRVFGPVLWINDRLVSILSIGSGAGYGGNAAAHNRQPTYSASVPEEKDVVIRNNRRHMSDATVESVEEGNGDVDAASMSRLTHAVASRVSGTTREALRLGGTSSGSSGRRRKVN